MYWPESIATYSIGDAPFISIDRTRSGHVIATASYDHVYIWQSEPLTVIASLKRTKSSLESQGGNSRVIIRGDGLLVTVQTDKDCLLLYSVFYFDEATQVLNHERHELPDMEDTLGCAMRYRAAIKIDGGIECVCCLHNEFIVATRRPVAVQTVKISEENTLEIDDFPVGMADWIIDGLITSILYDRPTGFYVWICSGNAYAVRNEMEVRDELKDNNSKDNNKKWVGWELGKGTCGAINSRFSLIAIGNDSCISVYSIKDYNGSLPFSHSCERKRFSGLSPDENGTVTSLSYSADGYVLMATYTSGWMLWSVYGRLLASSYCDMPYSIREAEGLGGITVPGCFGSAGLTYYFVSQKNLRVIKLAKNVDSCLVSDRRIQVPKPEPEPDKLTLTRGAIQWYKVPLPFDYLHENGPVRFVAVSPQSRYIAVAGARGFAHTDVRNVDWRWVFGVSAFEKGTASHGDASAGIIVRGMIWIGNVLAVGIEDEGYEIRLYMRSSQEYPLVIAREKLVAPVVTMSLCQGALLVYLANNSLLHYAVTRSDGKTAKGLSLHLVGQIGLDGIIRTPSRVRSLSWILHMPSGDPRMDLQVATLILLVDGRLVMMKPERFGTSDGDDESSSEQVRYALEVFSENVESFRIQDGLLWACSDNVKIWPEITTKNTLAQVDLDVEFYPLLLRIDSGVVSGVRTHVGRTKNGLMLLNMDTESYLFVHKILRYMLNDGRVTDAVNMARGYASLEYFSYMLEILLHEVLESKDDGALSRTVEFLKNFPREMLDVVVGCTRKTDVRKWEQLFKAVGPPRILFEKALDMGLLKTAGGYLLILQTLPDKDIHDSCQDKGKNVVSKNDNNKEESVDDRDARVLFKRAYMAGEWELCKELARFLASIDGKDDLNPLFILFYFIFFVL